MSVIFSAPSDTLSRSADMASYRSSTWDFEVYDGRIIMTMLCCVGIGGSSEVGGVIAD